MPAVNLLQLRVELNDLLWNFTDPPAFRNTLLDLLEKFAYTAYRSESKARAVSTRPQLQVSLILLREMDLVLIPAIREQPQAALAICDLLWNDENMDVCLIASRMLGEIPIEHAELVLDRAGEWALAGVRHMGVTRSSFRSHGASPYGCDFRSPQRNVSDECIFSFQSAV